MKIIRKYLKPQQWIIILSLTLAGISQLLSLIDPLIFGKIVETGPHETLLLMKGLY